MQVNESAVYGVNEKDTGCASLWSLLNAFAPPSQQSQKDESSTTQKAITEEPAELPTDAAVSREKSLSATVSKVPGSLPVPKGLRRAIQHRREPPATEAVESQKLKFVSFYFQDGAFLDDENAP